jgi:hypothetical protein
MVGETKPTEATANNAIIVLRNITILHQKARSLHCTSDVGSLPQIATALDAPVAQLCAIHV